MPRHAGTAMLCEGAPAAEMTKWFDTNYHYMVPEFTVDQMFRAGLHKAVDEYHEAKALGIETRPVLLGPVTYLLLGKTRGDGFRSAGAAAAPAPGLCGDAARTGERGATWMQIDEPCLVMDLSTRRARRSAMPMAN